MIETTSDKVRALMSRTEINRSSCPSETTMMPSRDTAECKPTVPFPERITGGKSEQSGLIRIANGYAPLELAIDCLVR